MAGLKNVVLVHGGFVDGAGWGGVYKILRQGGYQVSLVQNPTISLQDDSAAPQRILATQDGPAILVGHSYGGAVIPKPAPTRRWRRWCISPPLPPTEASPWRRSSKIRRRALPYRRFCRRRMVICSSTRRSSVPRSRLTWTRRPPHSWPTPRCRGGWPLSAERSANRRGGPSRAGIWWSPRTR